MAPAGNREVMREEMTMNHLDAALKAAEIIIKLAAVLGALGALGGAVYALYRFVARQKAQDRELQAMREENCLLTWGLSACLDGLMQLGANHSVPRAKEALDKHLNKMAHRMED